MTPALSSDVRRVQASQLPFQQVHRQLRSARLRHSHTGLRPSRAAADDTSNREALVKGDAGPSGEDQPLADTGVLPASTTVCIRASIIH